MNSFPLLQLPNELLHKIFHDDLDWNDKTQIVQLFRTSLTCKRLHDICLSSYLSHFGISEPVVYSAVTVRTAYEPQHDAISGLRAALFVPSIEHLSCTFEDALVLPNPASAVHAAILKSLARVHCLLEKLSSLTYLTLRFSGDQWNKQSVHGSDATLSAWSTAIGDLLDLCLQKGCISICLIDGNVMRYAYQFSYSRGLSVATRMVGSGASYYGPAIEGPGYVFSRSRKGENVILVNPSRHNDQLKTLDIRSSMLLLPPLSNWTISVLPGLRELVLSRVALAGHIWHAILPTLAIFARDLVSVSILHCPDITIDDIFSFLALLPKLQTIRVSDEEQYMPELDTPIPGPRQLKRVEAPWRILVYITSSPLPNLREVTTFPRRSPRRGIDWEGTAAVMRKLKESFLAVGQLERLPMVILKVVIDAGWLVRVHVAPSSSAKKAMRLVNVVQIEFLSAKVDVQRLGTWIAGAFESVKEIRLRGDLVAHCGDEEDIMNGLKELVTGSRVVVVR